VDLMRPNYLMLIVDRLRELAAEHGGKIVDDRLAAAYAVLVLTTGQATTLENVHDAWSAWRAFSDRPDHDDLVPFQMLDAGTAEWDRPYRDDIRRLAAELEAKREKRGDLR
jgi:hypothetical protein